MVVNVARREAVDQPARGAPSALFASVLTNIEVEWPSINLDDQAFNRPAQIRFLPGDTDVEAWHRHPGIAQDLERPDLRTASRPLERQPGVTRDCHRQPSCATASPIPAEHLAQLRQGGELDPDCLPYEPRYQLVAGPGG
jgi:hypothetical protein